MVPVNVQIPQLLTDKQFKLAEVLSNIGEGDLENRTKRVQLIQTLYAFDLFCNFKFQESMNVFFQLDIDPSHVIGLYPDLLPTVFRNQLQYPDKVQVHVRGLLLLHALHPCLFDKGSYDARPRHGERHPGSS